jgi:tRNA-Thr(GGU) m(6)t(6)A37 methyltransferase TsaA
LLFFVSGVFVVTEIERENREGKQFMEAIIMTPIGIIHSPYATKEAAPIQGSFCPEGKGTVEVFTEYEKGLKDIETFSHIILLYQFDRAGEIELVRPTFLDDKPHGVFASRHPCRPNSIGLTVVKLLKRKGNMLEVSGVDVLDGTPLIDIKPYLVRFDCHPEASEGWTAGKQKRPKPTGRE